VPYVYHLGDVASKVASTWSTDVSSVASSAVATASANMGAWLKKAALRAAGHEGLAENVLNEQGQPFGVDAVHIAEDLSAREEIRYRDELQWTNCLDTSGQVFAILLNCMYLLPLTWLFVQFFITSYINRMERRRSSTASEKAILARRSLQDASKGVARRLSEAVEEMHQTAADIGEDEDLAGGDEIKAELKDAARQAKTQMQKGKTKVKQVADGAGIDAGKVKQEVQRDMDKVRKNLQETIDKVKAAAAGKIDEAVATKDSVVADQKEKAAEKDTEPTEAAEETSDDVQEDVEAPEKKSPNGNGTGADGATGPTSSPEETESHPAEDEEDSSEVKEGKSFADAVKDDAEEEDSSEVKEGKSFADAAKE
jgi:hypothetical protein